MYIQKRLAIGAALVVQATLLQTAVRGASLTASLANAASPLSLVLGTSGVGGNLLGLCNCLPEQVCKGGVLGSNTKEVEYLTKLVGSIREMVIQGSSPTMCRASAGGTWPISSQMLSNGGTECLDAWIKTINPFSILTMSGGQLAAAGKAANFNVCEEFNTSLSNLLALHLTGAYNAVNQYLNYKKGNISENICTGRMGGAGISGACGGGVGCLSSNGNPLLNIYGLPNSCGAGELSSQGISLIGGDCNPSALLAGGSALCGGVSGSAGASEGCTTGLGLSLNGPCSNGGFNGQESGKISGGIGGACSGVEGACGGGVKVGSIFDSLRCNLFSERFGGYNGVLKGANGLGCNIYGSGVGLWGNNLGVPAGLGIEIGQSAPLGSCTIEDLIKGSSLGGCGLQKLSGMCQKQSRNIPENMANLGLLQLSC